MALRKTLITPEEYLKAERASETKHEYYDGEIFAMAGASENHVLIVGNTFASLHSQLRKRPCKAYSNDMRTRAIGKRFYTYPDIVVVCGTPKFEDNVFDTLINPTVLIEVLSASTEKYDRHEKFWHYRHIESLQEYLLISQGSVQIEHYIRQNGEWVLRDVSELDTVIKLDSVDCTLALADVYEKVIFDAEEGSTP